MKEKQYTEDDVTGHPGCGNLVLILMTVKAYYLYLTMIY